MTFFLPIEYKDKITQKFKNPDKAYKSGIHPGTDWGVPVDTPVYAPCDLLITNAIHNSPSMGNALYCKAGDVYFRFLHLSKLMHTGAYKEGQVIGYTGNTGLSTGPHLHVDVWKTPIDARKIYTRAGVEANLLDPEVFFA